MVLKSYFCFLECALVKSIPLFDWILSLYYKIQCRPRIDFAMSLCLIGLCLTSFWIGSATSCLWMYGLSWLRWWLWQLTDLYFGRRLLMTARTPLAFSGPYHCTSCKPFRSCGLYLSHMLLMANLEDKTMTTHASVSSLTVLALCVEGHVQFALAWISLHLCLPESDWVTLIGLVRVAICSSAACAGQEGVRRQTGLISHKHHQVPVGQQ